MKLSEFPVVSPDGKLIACAYRDEENGAPSKITILPFTGGAPIRNFDIPTNPWRLVRWSPDGQALTYVETQNGVSNLWSQPISGGKPKRLTNFLTERISSFAWSSDSKNLALARGVETREIVLISNFK